MAGPIGIFDSGYGGLTVFREIESLLPEYDYIYLGDNARAPYGARSFETVYRFTLECVKQLFSMGCRLVILACNTASAKALRNIQQLDLPQYGAHYRVLGVIRPTTEIVGHITRTGCIGILATPGTVKSLSYSIEIQHFFPNVRVYQQACPMWVPLIENDEHTGPGADYFVEKDLRALLAQADCIDTVVLGCTHYSLLLEKIRRYLPPEITLMAQGRLVADRLADYLRRHPEIEAYCSKGETRRFFTTETPEIFDEKASRFYGRPVQSQHLSL
ncbi:MAG: glutamate racemase [Saprospiraceae bacterium]|nr:glutamate racemase [Saprospiraceae bacterium]MDW8484833.1 glutamate racemase [Saprospiraceae bacterium]